MTFHDASDTRAADGLREAADTMRAVRDRCVWTQQIDHRALLPYLTEEAAELIDAVEDGTRADLREELGDLLWQVLFHAEIASRDAEDPFDIDDVARDLSEKMIRRHPHVFGDAVATTPDEVLVHWNAAKAAEKRTRTSVLDGVSHHMPALALAQKLLGKAATVGVADAPGPAFPPAAESARSHLDAEPVGKPHGLGAQSRSRESGRMPEDEAPDEAGTPEAQAPEDGGMPEDEAALGAALVGLVAHARERGWDAERALRTRLRALETEIRAAEAGVGAPGAPVVTGDTGEAVATAPPGGDLGG